MLLERHGVLLLEQIWSVLAAQGFPADRTFQGAKAMDRSWDLQIPPELSGLLAFGQELGSMEQRAGGAKESKNCPNSL